MYTRVKAGLKVAAVCALIPMLFDYNDNNGFSPIKTLTVFLMAFAIYEVLGFLENKIKS